MDTKAGGVPGFPLSGQAGSNVEQPLAGTYVIQNQRFTYVNSAFARIFGYQSPAEVVGAKRVYNLVSAAERRSVAKHAGCLISDGNISTRYSFCGVRQDGTHFDVEVHNSIVEHAGMRFVVGVAVDMSEINQITQRAFYDPLTGLPNRALLFDRLTHALSNAERSGAKFAVLFMDLDRFKPVNDNCGHAIGDRVLMSVAKRFGAALRTPDTLARLGGDEFIAILPEVARRSDVEAIAQRLIGTLETPITVDDLSFNLGVSIGIAFYPDHGKDAGDLYRLADAAMYRAKARGQGGTSQYAFAVKSRRKA